MAEKESTRGASQPVVKPVSDGPHEIEDAAAQEAEYPEDETDEG